MNPFPSPMGGQCACPCHHQYPPGALVIHDKFIHGTVINGHQTAVTK